MSPVYRFPSGRGPLARLLSTLILIGALALAFSLGVFIFIIALGVAVILGLMFWLRLWWLRRQWAKHRPLEPAPGGGVTLEGEYTVDKRDERRPGR